MMQMYNKMIWCLAFMISAISTNTYALQATPMMKFSIESIDDLGGPKRFINQTGHKIKIFYKVIDKATGSYWAQEPMIKDHDFYQVDFGAILLSQGAKKPKFATKGFMVEVSVAKVLKAPQQKGDSFKLIAFKYDKNEQLVSSATCKAHGSFRLVVDADGFLDCFAH